MNWGGEPFTEIWFPCSWQLVYNCASCLSFFSYTLNQPLAETEHKSHTLFLLKKDGFVFITITPKGQGNGRESNIILGKWTKLCVPRILGKPDELLKI